jgi:hypothetical protein
MPTSISPIVYRWGVLLHQRTSQQLWHSWLIPNKAVSSTVKRLPWMEVGLLMEPGRACA